MSAARQLPISSLEYAEQKMAKAVDKGQRCVSLTRAEWSALWMKENSQPVEVPISCSCAQRSYPHELSIHRAIKFESREARWPWSLRFVPEMEG